MNEEFSVSKNKKVSGKTQSFNYKLLLLIVKRKGKQKIRWTYVFVFIHAQFESIFMKDDFL